MEVTNHGLLDGVHVAFCDPRIDGFLIGKHGDGSGVKAKFFLGVDVDPSSVNERLRAREGRGEGVEQGVPRGGWRARGGGGGDGRREVGGGGGERNG